MRVKLLRNYYTRIILLSWILAFIFGVLAVIVILGNMNAGKRNVREQEYQELLIELEENYLDIYNQYYKVFTSMMDDVNAGYVRAFCENTAVGYEQYGIRTNFSHVLESACNQDSRIVGIYFRNIADDCRYVYSDKTRELEKVTYRLSEEKMEKQYGRYIIGGRRLGLFSDMKEKEFVNVFGIQSGIMRINAKNSYQITVLYDLNSFERILAKYAVDQKARFIVSEKDGTILYDSWGSYLYNEDFCVMYMEEIFQDKDEITVDGVTYIKRTNNLRKGEYLTYYLVPREVMVGYRLDASGWMVILIVTAILLLITCLMLFINRMISGRFRELENAMAQVGKNNLEYRISIEKPGDEFSQIASCFNTMCDDLNNMIHKNYMYQILQKNAEYRALQANVNPHFLYNALESVREKLDMDGRKDASEMVLLLSRIFEYQIRGNSIITISRELDALQDYIDFSEIRYQYAFDYLVHFEKEILNYAVPKQIFQPIMENYFVHGFRGEDDDEIEITGSLNQEDGMIHVCFCDNGKGLTDSRIQEINASLEETLADNVHIGLANVHSRLQIIYGKESYLRVCSNAPKEGISIRLVFQPVEKSVLERRMRADQSAKPDVRDVGLTEKNVGECF